MQHNFLGLKVGRRANVYTFIKSTPALISHWDYIGWHCLKFIFPPGAPNLQSSSMGGSGSGTHTPTPSSHGPSPTPSSGSGGGSGGQWASAPASHPPGYPMGDRRVRDATHERLIKKTRARQQQHPAVTPPVSPAKRGGRGEFFLIRCDRFVWKLTDSL